MLEGVVRGLLNGLVWYETFEVFTACLLLLCDKSLNPAIFNKLIGLRLLEIHQHLHLWGIILNILGSHSNKTPIYGINRPTKRVKMGPKYQGVARAYW